MDHTVHLRTDLTPEERKKLEKFVFEHPEGNLFQSPVIFDCYRSVPGYYPVYFYSESDQGLCGILLAVLIRSPGIPFSGKLTSRVIIWGGPLAGNADAGIMSGLLKAYGRWLGRKSIYTEIRNYRSTGHLDKVFREEGFHYVRHLNILIDLTRTEEELWGMVHSKRRNEIRRAVKEGTEVRHLNSREVMLECYGILRQVYHRARHPLPPPDYFTALYDKLSPLSHLEMFTAHFEGKLIGCMLTLAYKNVLYDLFAGSYREYYSKYPNDLITWEAIKWAKNNGFEVFDFGGAGRPDVPYGVRNYKMKFGGSLFEFGRYRKIHSPFTFWLAGNVLTFVKKLRSR
jgi:serine/alanine adding enzyme